MPSEQFQARLNDAKAEAVHDLADRLDLGKSEMTGALIERGLETWGPRVTEDLLDTVSLALAIAGLVAFLAFWTVWAFVGFRPLWHEQDVLAPGLLTVAYLTAGWIVARRSWRRS